EIRDSSIDSISSHSITSSHRTLSTTTTAPIMPHLRDETMRQARDRSVARYIRAASDILDDATAGSRAHRERQSSVYYNFAAQLAAADSTLGLLKTLAVAPEIQAVTRSSSLDRVALAELGLGSSLVGRGHDERLLQVVLLATLVQEGINDRAQSSSWIRSLGQDVLLARLLAANDQGRQVSLQEAYELVQDLIDTRYSGRHEQECRVQLLIQLTSDAARSSSALASISRIGARREDVRDIIESLVFDRRPARNVNARDIIELIASSRSQLKSRRCAALDGGNDNLADLIEALSFDRSARRGLSSRTEHDIEQLANDLIQDRGIERIGGKREIDQVLIDALDGRRSIARENRIERDAERVLIDLLGERGVRGSSSNEAELIQDVIAGRCSTRGLDLEDILAATRRAGRGVDIEDLIATPRTGRDYDLEDLLQARLGRNNSEAETLRLIRNLERNGVLRTVEAEAGCCGQTDELDRISRKLERSGQIERNLAQALRRLSSSL
ncbi:hypothetical protein E5Q_01815, partial [Mixia osmundae IAM 14324]